MKRTFQIAFVLVVLNTLALTLWSRAAAPPAAVVAAKPTRVAVLNLTYVVKNYEKFKSYQAELQKVVQPYQERDTRKKAAGEALAKELQEPGLLPEQKATMEKKLKQLQREMEDNKAEAQAILVKKQEAQLKSLYLDIEEATRRLARKRGFDLVLHYNDVLADEEKYSAANIARKMQAGALMPMHAEAGFDVSNEVLDDLNKALKLERL